jgi:hypothetical protein
MINKKYPLNLCQQATMRGVNGRGSDGSGDLLGLTLFLLQWQRRQRPVGEDTIHVLVLMVVDEGSWRQQQRWGRLAADDCVDGSGR